MGLTKLGEKLDTIRAAGQSRIPEEARAVMERSVAEVRASGLVGRAVTVGDRIPAFTLPSVKGTSVSSADLLTRSPLVLSFYRGRW